MWKQKIKSISIDSVFCGLRAFLFAKPTKLRPGDLLESRVVKLEVLFTIFFLLFCIRATILSLFPLSAPMLKKLAEHQYNSEMNLAPYRGTVFDHHMNPLAISMKTPSLSVNPKVFRPTKKQIYKLTMALGISAQKIESLKQKKSYFAWLKRNIDYDTAEKIRQLNINGINFLVEPFRYYPENESLAHVLGFVGSENTGLFGLEKTYESVLKAPTKPTQYFKDGRGNAILLNTNLALPETAGNNIILTIDRVIQKITEDALRKWYLASEAKSAFAIVADPHTGKILAIANQPSFDPNQKGQLNIQFTRNSAISERFEPGSVMKPFVIGAALEKKLIKEDSIFNCEASGKLNIDGTRFIHDDHPKATLTTAQVLIESNNICTYKIAEKLGKESLFAFYKSFGFSTDPIKLKLPQESKGQIDPWEKWQAIRFANIAFGQGVLVTALELVRGYSVLANGGGLITPHLVERIETSTGEILEATPMANPKPIISPETASTLRRILYQTVQEGTGRLAKTATYTSAGKTGTAEKADPVTKGYPANKRIASFAGFAPAFDPHLVVFVAIDEPQKKPYYGGTWAAPVFSEIIEQSLHYLNVTSDMLPEPLPTPAVANKEVPIHGPKAKPASISL